MSDGWIVTGVCAAGKTTVATLLAERLGLPFVEGDALHHADAPSEERYTRVVSAVPGAVVEDVILGDWLAWVVDRAAPCRLVVLAPSHEAVAARNAARGKDGYHTYTVEELDRGLRERTPRLGLWVDNTDQIPDETVDEILARADEAVV